MTAIRTVRGHGLDVEFPRDFQINAAKRSCASTNATPTSIIAQTISRSISGAWLEAAVGIHQCRETNRAIEVSETQASRMAKTLPG